MTLDVPAMCRRLGIKEPWHAPLIAAMSRHDINTPRRAAAFLATLHHESAGFTRLVENLNYSPEKLMATWPKRFDRVKANALGRRRAAPGVLARPALQPDIAEVAYGGRMGNDQPGDGWRYRGRGLIQLTGRANYREFGFEDNPDDAAKPEGAAEIAAAFWSKRGCNAMADRGDIAGWRKAINGGHIGLDAVTALYRAALPKT